MWACTGILTTAFISVSVFIKLYKTEVCRECGLSLPEFYTTSTTPSNIDPNVNRGANIRSLTNINGRDGNRDDNEKDDPAGCVPGLVSLTNNNLCDANEYDNSCNNTSDLTGRVSRASPPAQCPRGNVRPVALRKSLQRREITQVEFEKTIVPDCWYCRYRKGILNQMHKQDICPIRILENGQKVKLGENEDLRRRRTRKNRRYNKEGSVQYKD